MTDWQTAPPPPFRITAAGWLRVLLRGLTMSLVTYGGLLLLLLLRLVEAPLFRAERPWTPYLTQAVCRANCAILGLRLQPQGRPMTAMGAIVANHSSWLDIFT